MEIKIINALEEMQEYYNEEENTYDFYDIDLIIFNCDLNVKANIIANDIYAEDINALYIEACNIKVNNDIKANAINCCDLWACNIEIKYIDTCNIKADSIEALTIENREDISAESIKTKTIHSCNIIAEYVDAEYINAINVIKL